MPGSAWNLVRSELRHQRDDVLLNSIVASRLVPRLLRGRILRMLGQTGIHATALINAGTFLGSRHGLEMGPRAFINNACFLDLGASIRLEEGAGLGYEVMIITCSHELGEPARRYGRPTTAPVVIGAGAWIGSRAVIMPGVTIGAGAVVGVGSVVTKDCLPDSFYAGVPATFVKALDGEPAPAETAAG